MVKKTAVKTVRLAKKAVEKTAAIQPKSAKAVESASKSVEAPQNAEKTVKKTAKIVKPVQTATVRTENKPKTPVSAKAKPANTVPASSNKALVAAEIEELRIKLLDLRSRMRGEVGTMTSAALTEKDEGQSSVPLHLADVGSDNYEQEQTLSFIESGSNTLLLIENALVRIKNGTYGICESCGCNIPKQRLNFIPFTATCVKCVETEV